MKLVRSEIDNKSYLPEDWIMLTEKGKDIFEETKKTEEIMKR